MTSHSRTRVAELIGDKIIRQDLPPGRSVGESALANEFGTSRTPIREALLGLEIDGLVNSTRGRGFVVEGLSAEEARDVYPIIAGLERLAVASSPPAPQSLLKRLKALNRDMAAAETPEARMRVDATWHRAVVSGSGNARLERLIESVKKTTLRYEFVYLKSTALRDKSIEEHEQIVALIAESPPLAGEAIERHWHDGMNAVLEMFGGDR